VTRGCWHDGSDPGRWPPRRWRGFRRDATRHRVHGRSPGIVSLGRIGGPRAVEIPALAVWPAAPSGPGAGFFPGSGIFPEIRRPFSGLSPGFRHAK
jgi:hypothetical protein